MVTCVYLAELGVWRVGGEVGIRWLRKVKVRVNALGKPSLERK